MIEENLMQYGILGLWTASLITERYRWQKGVSNALNKLTKAIEEKF